MSALTGQDWILLLVPFDKVLEVMKTVSCEPSSETNVLQPMYNGFIAAMHAQVVKSTQEEFLKGFDVSAREAFIEMLSTDEDSRLIGHSLH